MDKIETNPSRFPTLKRLLGWQTWRRLLFAVAALATIVALVYAIENYRGKKAWEEYAKAQETKGVSFDFRSSVPAPVPAEQNFAMTPFLAPLYDFEPGTQIHKDTNAVKRTQELNTAVLRINLGRESWRENILADLAPWGLGSGRGQETNVPVAGQTNAPSRAVLAQSALDRLKEMNPIIEELRLASQRPKARFNIRYEEENSAGILLPHLSVIRNAMQILMLRSVAELELGRTDDALADIQLLMRICEAVKDEPVLISQLVRMAGWQMALQPVWEGIAARKWSDAQLQAFQREIQQVDILASTAMAMNGERMSFGGRMFDYIRNNPSVLQAIESPETANPLSPVTIMRLMPKGWLYFEQVNYHRMFEQWVVPGSDPMARRVMPKTIENNSSAVVAELKAPGALLGHRILSGMLIPAVVNLHKRSAYAQNSLDLALVACALERYRLKHNGLPESLGVLNPEHLAKLPHDVISGEPLKFRTNVKGGYLIYSVGWNEKDDGGKIVIGSNKKVELENGDWVWESPAK